jgi:hypothetical protein
MTEGYYRHSEKDVSRKIWRAPARRRFFHQLKFAQQAPKIGHHILVKVAIKALLIDELEKRRRDAALQG